MPQATGIYYLRREAFVNWAKKCIDMLKELVTSFTTVGDVVWRDKAVQLMTQNQITPSDYLKMIKENCLKSVPVKRIPTDKIK